jgi:hypothetical protein
LGIAFWQVGLFLGLLGLTVLPISAVVGNYISNIYEDRYALFWRCSDVFKQFIILLIFGKGRSGWEMELGACARKDIICCE